MWNYYRIVMDFRTPLCGGIPLDPKIRDKWLELRKASAAKQKRMAKHPAVLEEGIKQQSLDEIKSVHDVRIAQALESEDTVLNACGFFRSAEGFLMIRGASFRAHVKACFEVLAKRFKTTTGAAEMSHEGKLNGKPQMVEPKGDLKASASKFCQDSWASENEVLILGIDGKPLKAPSEIRPSTLNPMTAQGRRTSIKLVEQVHPARCVFVLQVLGGSEVTVQHLVCCLEYGADQGFNQDRALGRGRYRWTMTCGNKDVWTGPNTKPGTFGDLPAFPADLAVPIRESVGDAEDLDAVVQEVAASAE